MASTKLSARVSTFAARSTVSAVLAWAIDCLIVEMSVSKLSFSTRSALTSFSKLENGEKIGEKNYHDLR